MTGYTVHTGSNDKFRDGWDNIFAGKTKKSAKKTVKAKKAATAKKQAGAKKKSGKNKSSK